MGRSGNTACLPQSTGVVATHRLDRSSSVFQSPPCPIVTLTKIMYVVAICHHTAVFLIPDYTGAPEGIGSAKS